MGALLCACVIRVRQRGSSVQWNKDTQELLDHESEEELVTWGPAGFELPED